MPIKWSKKDMISIAIAVVVSLVGFLIRTCFIDVTALTYMRKRNTWDPTRIKEISENYVTAMRYNNRQTYCI